jgi:hypothetical protein
VVRMDGRRIDQLELTRVRDRSDSGAGRGR